MTINGGKPHAVGDRGQRFEVTFFNPATFKRQVLGWCETREDAERIVTAMESHPVWEQFQIEDRCKTPAEFECLGEPSLCDNPRGCACGPDSKTPNVEVSGCLRAPKPEDAPRTAAGSPLDRPVGPVAGA